MNAFTRINDQRLSRIVAYVADRCETGILDVMSPTRSAHICQVRSVITFLARDLTAASWVEIARAYGRTDHTTAKNSYKQALRLMRESEHHRQMIHEFRKELSEEFMG